MIRNEREYQEAVARVEQEKARLAQHEAHLRQQGLKPQEARKAMEPLQAFHLQLTEEIAAYERLRRGQFDDVLNFQGLGQLLVALRIASGLTQKQLAERLHVDEAVVSRDERNEYHNVGIEKAQRILNAMGVRLRTSVELPLATAAA